jgi:hypothetical protein
MRDIDTIHSELPLVAALRRAALEFAAAGEAYRALIADIFRLV